MFLLEIWDITNRQCDLVGNWLYWELLVCIVDLTSDFLGHFHALPSASFIFLFGGILKYFGTPKYRALCKLAWVNDCDVFSVLNSAYVTVVSCLNIITIHFIVWKLFCYSYTIFISQQTKKVSSFPSFVDGKFDIIHN